MRTIHVLMMTALMMTAGLVAGCDRKVMAPGAGTADPITQENYPRVVALEGLAEYLSFGPAVVTGDATHPLSVQVPVRVRSDKEVSIQYQYQFLDEQGRLIDAKSQDQWTFHHLPARAQFFLAGSAVDTKAKDWRLLVRPAR